MPACAQGQGGGGEGKNLDAQRVGRGGKTPKLLLGGRQALNRTFNKFAICCRRLSAPPRYASSTGSEPFRSINR